MHTLEKLVRLLPERIIERRNNEPYLSRFYLVPRKRPKWLPGIYIHCFHASDEDLELHDHPWKQAISLILSGSYREEYKVGDEVKERVLSPGRLNFISGDSFHRIDLVGNKKVWTLFFSFMREKDWGFWNRETGEYTQHLKFINKKLMEESWEEVRSVQLN